MDGSGPVQAPPLRAGRQAHGEAVVLEAVLGLDLGLVRLILGAELLGLLDHAVDLSLTGRFNRNSAPTLGVQKPWGSLKRHWTLYRDQPRPVH